MNIKSTLDNRREEWSELTLNLSSCPCSKLSVALPSGTSSVLPLSPYNVINTLASVPAPLMSLVHSQTFHTVSVRKRKTLLPTVLILAPFPSPPLYNSIAPGCLKHDLSCFTPALSWNLTERVLAGINASILEKPKPDWPLNPVLEKPAPSTQKFSSKKYHNFMRSLSSVLAVPWLRHSTGMQNRKDLTFSCSLLTCIWTGAKQMLLNLQMRSTFLWRLRINCSLLGGYQFSWNKNKGNTVNHTWPSFQSHIFRLKEISFNQLVSFIIGQPLLTQKYLLISTAGAVDNHLRVKQNTQKLGISNHSGKSLDGLRSSFIHPSSYARVMWRQRDFREPNCMGYSLQ